MKNSLSSTLVVLTGLAAGLTATVANAAIVGDAFVISATNANGTFGIVVTQAQLTFEPLDSSYSYIYSGPAVVLANGVTVESFDIFFQDDPTIAMTFVGFTGGLATSFSISSGALVFAPLVGQTAYAGSAMTLTGINGSNANLAGGFGGNAHLASFNTGPFLVNIPSFGVANPNGTNSVSGDTGPVFVAGPVAGMQVDWNFAVDANDSVSLNSFFTITPAPGALGLLGVGGLLIARRRR